MTENDSDTFFDIIILVIAAAGAIMWNVGIINSVIKSGVISDPAVQIFLLLVFAILLAEIYIVNTKAIRFKLNKALGSKRSNLATALALFLN